MIPMLGGAGVCGVLGYLLQKSADGKAEEAVEMRRTNTTPTNRLYKDLNENGGTRVAEIYGKTYAPVKDQVKTYNNQNAVAVKKSTFECVEECEWVERMARRRIQNPNGGGSRSEMVGTGVGDWQCKKSERHITTSAKGSRLFLFDQNAFVADQRVRDAQLRIARDRARARGDYREEMEINDALRKTQRQVEGTEDVPLEYVVAINNHAGLGGGNAFFELSSEHYRPNEAPEININVNTSSTSRPDDTHRTRILGWYDREYYVPLNKNVYALGEVSLEKLQTTADLMKGRKGMVMNRPSNPAHHFICEPGTESEVYERKMKSARTTQWASNVMYGAAGFFVLGGVVIGATQSNASNSAVPP